MKNLNYEQINQIYSSTKKHVKMLAELAAWTGINRSEYLRRLIEVEHARVAALKASEAETQPTN